MSKKKINTMEIKSFIETFERPPVLFVGTGLSLRYLKESYTWDNLLYTIANHFLSEREYLDLKIDCRNPLTRECDYPKLGEALDNKFTTFLRNGCPEFLDFINELYYKEVNSPNYSKMPSRIQIYIASLLNSFQFKDDPKTKRELEKLKKCRTNISSIITTNYDKMLESIFDYKSIIRNDILSSTPYGSIYKIHGCISQPNSLVLTETDYIQSRKRDDLIRAHLISLFIHNPVVFLGYGNSDENVNGLLETIFRFTDADDKIRAKMTKNFLLVEYIDGSANTKVQDFGYKSADGDYVSIKKIATDDYETIYDCLASKVYPISAETIIKVEGLIYDMYSSVEDKRKVPVEYVEAPSDMKVEDKVWLITQVPKESTNEVKQVLYKDKIKTVHLNQQDFIANYFEIIDSKNIEDISIIDRLKPKVSTTANFPIFGFSEISGKNGLILSTATRLKDIQENAITSYREKLPTSMKEHISIAAIIDDEDIAPTYKDDNIFYNIYENSISLEETRKYLLSFESEKKDSTFFRRLVTLYDYKMYAESEGGEDKE